jgi:hypothetical protein
MMLSQKTSNGMAKHKARDYLAMRRTYVCRSSEAVAATQQLAGFCDAIKFVNKNSRLTSYVECECQGCKQLMQSVNDVLVSIYFTIRSSGSVVRAFDLEGH